MKKVFTIIFITLLVMAGLCGLGYYYQDEIYIYYQEEVLKVKDNITISKNDYYKDNNYIDLFYSKLKNKDIFSEYIEIANGYIEGKCNNVRTKIYS